jgi:hypothetical protein
VRNPLYIIIINTILKYLNRIIELDHDSLLYQSFLESKSIWQSGKESWFSNFNKMSKELNTNIEDYDINSVKEFLITKFQKYWIKKIELNGKLDTYQKFEFNFRREIYLNEVENKNHRRYLTKFRISVHNLEIEIGRYKNKPRDERLCSGCLKVEIEVNFLFECNSYSTLRDDFTNTISSIVPNYLKLNNDLKLIHLMTCEDKNILRPTSLFIFNCFKKREISQLSSGGST